MKTMQWLCVIAIPVICLSGCRTVVNEGPAHATRVDHQNTRIQYNNVVFLDKHMVNKVEVQRSGAERTPTDTVEVYVVFRNRTDFPQQIECRVTFFDRLQVPLGDPGGWQRVIMEPNAIQAWRESSLSVKAQYYYVEIREGR